MLSAAKHLGASRNGPFAEFTLSEANGLRVTRCDCSNGQGLFFTLEPCLTMERVSAALICDPEVNGWQRFMLFPYNGWCLRDACII